MKIREVDLSGPRELAVSPPGSRRWVIWLALNLVVATLGILFMVNMFKENKLPENHTLDGAPTAPAEGQAQKKLEDRENAHGRKEAPNGLLEQAAKALVEGDGERAQSLLRAAEIEWQRLMGLLEYRKGNFNSALQRFQLTASSEFSEISDLINMASTLAALGRKDEAIVAFGEARRKNLDDDYAANRYYLALVEYGRDEQAEKEIATALQSSPTQSLAQIALAASVLEFRKGRKGKSLDFYVAARSLLPDEIFGGLNNESVLDGVRDLVKTD